MYKFQVNYSKRFTTGPFAGSLHHGHLRFATRKSADEFRTLCESGHEFRAIGGWDYRAEDVSLFAIEPMPA